MKLLNNPLWKRVLKGNLFKGHVFQLITSTDGGSNIEIHQTYYNFSSHQVYYSKTDSTESRMTYGVFTSRVPKWYINMLKDLEQRDAPTNMHCENGDYSIYFNYTWVYIEYKSKFKGAYFTNHYENILAKKELSKISSRVMSRIKKLDIIDLSVGFKRDEYGRYIVIPPEFLE